VEEVRMKPWAAALLMALFVGAMSVVAVQPATTQSTSQLTPPGPLPCGWNTGNSQQVIAASPPGAGLAVSVGSPSWEQACYTFAGPNGSGGGLSFVSYEVFPITVSAPPNTTVTLQAGRANPTLQQMTQDGVRNTTIWTWFDPDTVVTNAAGVATANFTLVGAVMPFVANDISNVSLPIQAQIPGGASASVGLPVEFNAMSPGGVTILKTPGPIVFGETSEWAGGGPANSFLTLVYGPPGGRGAPPIQVSLDVLGSYVNGSVGPMPTGVYLSFPQSRFELQPDSVFYLRVNLTNSLRPTNATTLPGNYANFTLAVQEKFGGNTFVEPLSVSILLNPPITFGGPPSNATTSQSSITTALNPGPAPETSQAPQWTVAAVAAVIAAVLVVFAAVNSRSSSNGGRQTSPSSSP
jgi:hypothetical protein